MALKRREFLQKASWALAALGITEATLGQIGAKEAIAASAPPYYDTLVQPTGRKLALLVGINQYPNVGTQQTTPLQGCVTDVELQRELLTCRFGFHPSDILTLTDSQATRENIQAAFLSHLTNQAKDGDVVVFHFSGYGSRVSAGTSAKDLQNSFVPANDLLPTEESPIVNDLLEETLWLMLRSLPTPHKIALLDTSHSYAGTDLQGNLRLRSRDRPTLGQPSPKELAFLAQLQTPLTLPLAILRAAGPSQIAAETQWNGFTAGLFTYALTQTLWWATPTTHLQISFSRAASAVEELAGPAQQPQLLGNTEPKALPATTISEASLILPPGHRPADGAVRAVEDSKIVELWLAGLPPAIVEAYGVNSLLTLVPPPDAPSPNPVLAGLIRARTGLVAKAEIQVLGIGGGELSLNPQSPTAGQLVQEAIRVLPRNTGLTVAIDSGLERIERVDATSAFASIPQVSGVMGELPADCRFSRVVETTPPTPNAPLIPFPRRYALFSLNQTLIPNTAGEGGEAVKVAVQRLVPQLKTLLAAKLLRLTANEGSSRQAVKASLVELAPIARVLMERSPVRTGRVREPLPPLTADNRDRVGKSNLLDVPGGTRIQYRLQNDSDRPVYFMVFCLDSAGRAIVVNPVRSPLIATGENTSEWEPQHIIHPGENLSVPAALDADGTGINAFGWAIHGPSGLAETQILFSQAPFAQTLAALNGAMLQVRDTQGLRVLLNPLTVAQAVLQDLHHASVSGVQKAGISTDDFALDVNAWATLSFVYRVV